MKKNTNIIEKEIEGTSLAICKFMTYHTIDIGKCNNLNSYESIEFDDKMDSLIIGRIKYYVCDLSNPSLTSELYDSIIFDEENNCFVFELKDNYDYNNKNYEFKLIFNANIKGEVEEVFYTGIYSRWIKLPENEPNNIFSKDFCEHVKNYVVEPIYIYKTCFYKHGKAKEFIEEGYLENIFEEEKKLAIKILKGINGDTLTLPVKDIKYDAENNVYNITDYIWLDSENAAYLYFTIKGFNYCKDDYTPVGYAYTDALDSIHRMNFNIMDLAAYGEFKYRLAIKINEERRKRIEHHQENQLKFIKSSN